MTIKDRLALMKEIERRNNKRWDIAKDLSDFDRLNRELKQLKNPEYVAARVHEVFPENKRTAIEYSLREAMMSLYIQ